MKTVLIILFNIAFQSIIFSQNFIPDGSFESTTDLDYMDPASAFSYLDYWLPANNYIIDTLYRGTPDLFDTNNRWPQSNPPSFWNIANGATDGNFHVGIANHMTYEGYLTPEAISTSLTQPLEAGEFYHIELNVRNKGVAGYQKDPILCVQQGYKNIDILLDPDSIFVVIDEQNKDSYIDASKTITLSSSKMEYFLQGGWFKIGTCFQAQGGEQFLGITTTTGSFTVDAPCFIYDEHWDVFYVYYFDIDDVKLTKLPEEFTLNQTICAGRETEINIASLVDIPIMQNEIEYHWDDGRIDSINYISEAGTYFVNAVVDCKIIPIVLKISDLKCGPDVFVPNAFSPNGDGTNDQLETFISVDLPLKEYQFSVFNRWGSEVFSTNDSDAGWDGTFNGDLLDNSVYVWLLEYTIDDFELGLINYQERGDVTIFR